MFSTPPGPRRLGALSPLVTVTLVTVVVLAVVVTTLATRGADNDPSGTASTSGNPSAAATPEPTPTPLADLDTTVMTVQRAAFCDLVDPAALEQALGGKPAAVRSYGNGEPALVAPGVKDISHEHGCRWKRGGTVARGWVFAPPVTPADADLLRKEARSEDGCTRRGAAPAFGSPSLARTCSTGKSSPVEASFRGLFGDAWLACSLTDSGSVDAVLDRAAAWCAAVALAAATPPAD